MKAPIIQIVSTVLTGSLAVGSAGYCATVIHKDSHTNLIEQTPLQHMFDLREKFPDKDLVSAEELNMYQEYLDILMRNKKGILEYDDDDIFGANSDYSIAFTDICGDDMPELIFAACTERYPYGGSVNLNVYTYEYGTARKVYSDKIASHGPGGGTDFVLFQVDGDKSLYCRQQMGYEAWLADMYRFDMGDDSNLHRTELLHGAGYDDMGGFVKEYRVDGMDATEQEFEETEKSMSESIAKFVMYDDYCPEMMDNTGADYGHTDAISYANAIAYLRYKLGIPVDIRDHIPNDEFFSGIKDMYFTMCSGTGGWSTYVILDGTGGFSGSYQDRNGNKTISCPFHGMFDNVRQIDEFTYAFDMVSLEYEPFDDYVDSDGMRYTYSEYACGIDGGSTFYLFLPDVDTRTLPEEFISWVGLPFGWGNNDIMIPRTLPFYGLYNVNTAEGFWSDESSDISEEPSEHSYFFNDRTNVVVNFDWNSFTDAYTYNKELAKLSCVLNVHAYYGGDSISGFINDNFAANSCCQYNYGSDFLEAPACTIAERKISQNGQEKLLFIIVIRGTFDGEDIVTDALSLFDDFDPACADTFREFKDFYDNNNDVQNFEGDVKSNSIFYITGHSLGAAVAACLTKDLVTNNYANKENTFTYTLASPRYLLNPFEDNYYPNIHNIVNIDDRVPELLEYKTRMGKDHFFCSLGNEMSQTLLRVYTPEYLTSVSRTVNEIFLNIQNHSIPRDCGDYTQYAHNVETYLAGIMADLPLIDYDENSAKSLLWIYTLIECPVDICVLDEGDNVVAWTSGENTVYEDPQAQVIVFTCDDAKVVIAPEEYVHSIAIIGTADGEMKFSHRVIDDITRDIVSETVFDNVEVKTDKVMYSSLGFNDDNTVDLFEVNSNGNAEARINPNGTEDSSVKIAVLKNKGKIVLAGGSTVLFAASIIIPTILKKRKKETQNNMK